ncbi:MAG: DNA gyrase subunit A [Deltaproteobacteria bacterium]|nr:DNA gyrase subunit A [Deltaproteobacteria bacterium]MBS3920979.1 DNA gyrase subunit A [Deltaproteobacteria bacterium]
MNEYQLAIPVNIEDEMKKSYMDYAMSVIIGRALPDVRDGLKPVHRRILYSMNELNNDWDKPYKKSARIVGDVIGKYHPHGDMAVYDSIVRMAQDFSLRYTLIDGQGNFGSVDGDPPAAMRYTEIRMAKLAGELLADIDKETVDVVPNYDESLFEPSVLPSKFPNLLVNGSSGIAVGMATNIPPHNLTETINGLIALIDNPDISSGELMSHIPGPDFPTGGFIYGQEGIRSAYETGKGVIQLRARAIIERDRKGERESIVVTELPYQTNKAKLIEKIAELAQEKVIEGISAVRDESDREGMRVVIELKRNEVPEVILNQLYKHTQMQTSFGIILLAIHQNQPKLLPLKEMLHLFLQHRREVVTRRSLFELKKAEARAHILEGLKKAIDQIDAIIATIKASKTPKEARERLMDRFDLSEEQAQAILEMRLQRLTNLEQRKIVEEYEETIKLINRLKDILASERLMLNVIKEELVSIRDAYGDERHTEIVDVAPEIKIEDLIAEEDMVVTITHTGYIKRNPISLYRSQHRGGKGKMGINVKEEDFVEDLFIASTHDYLLFFTDAGKIFWKKVHEVPQAGRITRGKAIINLLNLSPEEKVTAILSLKDFSPGKFITFITKKGTIKKTALEAYSNPRAGGIIALGLDEGDELISTKLTDGERYLFIGTKMGKAIHFSENQIREMGRTARGIRGIRLSKGDEVVGMEVVLPHTPLLTVTEHGYGKRSQASEYRTQNRGGSGIFTVKRTKKTGDVVGVKSIMDEDELMIISNKGKIIRLRAADIPVQGRSTQGVRLITIEEGERVVAVAKLAEKE